MLRWRTPYFLQHLGGGWRGLLVGVAAVISLGLVLGGLIAHKRHRDADTSDSAQVRTTDFDSILDGNDAVGHDVKPVATLSAQELIREYEQNEFAAESNYEKGPRTLCLTGMSDRCDVVEITGRLADLGRDAQDVAVLRLATDDPFVYVEARFGPGPQPELATVVRGQIVAIRCMVMHRSGRPPLLLTRCRIPDKSQDLRER